MMSSWFIKSRPSAPGTKANKPVVWKVSLADLGFSKSVVQALKIARLHSTENLRLFQSRNFLIVLPRPGWKKPISRGPEILKADFLQSHSVASPRLGEIQFS